MRPSGTEDIVRVYAEASTQASAAPLLFSMRALPGAGAQRSMGNNSRITTQAAADALAAEVAEAVKEILGAAAAPSAS